MFTNLRGEHILILDGEQLPDLQSGSAHATPAHEATEEVIRADMESGKGRSLHIIQAVSRQIGEGNCLVCQVILETSHDDVFINCAKKGMKQPE